MKVNNIIKYFSISALFILGCFYFWIERNRGEIVRASEKKFLVDNISISDGKLTLQSYNDDVFYCNASTLEDLSTDSNWIESSDKVCSIDISEGKYYLFVKFNDEIIKINGTENLGTIEVFETSEKKMYVALNSKQKINVDLKYYGNIDSNITYKSDDEEILEVNNEGYICGKKNGTTTVHVILSTLDSIDIEVTVTPLIVDMPKTYDFKKNYLSCNRYTSEEAKLLDEILYSRIDQAGYQTRAGVVTAVRFLMLEFPYRINYYSENGRLTGIRKADGEGRYYHRGLYLNNDKFDSLVAIDSGPAIWGCPLYSYISDKYLNNGLDCSGFVTWALINGGFDSQDIGAGITYNALDLTDLGEMKKLTNDLLYSNKIKAGDLIGYDGHIAIIAGVDNYNIYVAEALWYGSMFGVTITEYPKSEITKTLDYVMLMDSYYKNDGNYTAMWY